MIYKNRTRTKNDYKPEFAALRLPHHPITRYNKIFSQTYLRLRHRNHAPTPTVRKKDDACCFSCLLLSEAIPSGDMPNRILWEKKANARWFKARWFWDFGFTLPAGLSDFGVGVSPPITEFITPKNYLFSFDVAGRDILIKNGANLLTMEQHAQLNGENIHPTRIRSTSSVAPALYKGELAISTTGAAVLLLGSSLLSNGKIGFKTLTPPTDYSGVPLAVWGDQEGGFWKDGQQLSCNNIPI